MSAPDTALQCSNCGRVLGSQSALTLHLKTHNVEDPLASLRASIPGAPRPGGVKTDRPLRTRPSGIPAVDYAIGVGGVPMGTMIEVFGPSQTGKTLLALTFSAYAQTIGGRAGFMDAERAMQETFLKLVPNLDVDALEYGMPPDGNALDKDGQPLYPPAQRKKMLEQGWDGSGEAALEASRTFIKSGEFAVWTIDSVHACTPRQMLGLPINDKQAAAALARLMSQACQVMEHEVARTSTLVVWVNHIKHKPNVKFGRDWTKPGGSALDYYGSVQLEVRPGESYYSPQNVKLGHEVKVTLYKSKVSAPHVRTSFDLFFKPGIVRGKEGVPQREVTTGVDVLSSWVSVAKESGRVEWAGSRYIDAVTGEAIGSMNDLREALADTGSTLFQSVHAVVYPAKYVSNGAAP